MFRLQYLVIKNSNKVNYLNNFIINFWFYFQLVCIIFQFMNFVNKIMLLSQ